MDAELSLSRKAVNLFGVDKDNISKGLSVFYETFPFKELTPFDIQGELLPCEERTVGRYEFRPCSYSDKKESWGKNIFYEVGQKSPSTISEMKRGMGDQDYENTGIWSYSRLQNEHRDGILMISVPNDGDRISVHFDKMGFEGHPLGGNVSYNHARNFCDYILQEKDIKSSLNVVRLCGDWKGLGQGPRWDNRMRSIEQKLRGEINPHIGTPLFIGKRKAEKVGENDIDTLFWHNYGMGGGGMYYAGFEDITNLSGFLSSNASGTGGRFPFTKRSPSDLLTVVTHPETEGYIIDAIKNAFGENRDIAEIDLSFD